MKKGKEYLLKLEHSPSIKPQEGSHATIYDWSKGGSFSVISIVTSQSDWAKSAHVQAIENNSYNNSNCKGSRIRFRDAHNETESREILSVTEL